jgi:hypothetical protein
MVCALSLHVFHAPLIWSNFLWHVCILSQPRPDLRPSGRVLAHRYLAGFNRDIRLISTVQHELRLTSHGGWASVFCWSAAVRACERRATLLFRAPQPTRMMHCESSVNTSRVKRYIEIGHHSPHDHSPARPAWPQGHALSVLASLFHADVYSHAATHLRQVWGLLIPAVYGRAAEWIRQFAQECGRNQQTPTPRTASV